MLLDSINTGTPAPAKTLARMCDRLAVSLDAGIDVRRAWRSEVGHLSGRGASAAEAVCAAIDQGQPLDEAVAAAGDYFPPLLLELTRVGERTATTPDVYRRLAKHYQRKVSRARDFRRAIAWPTFQFGMALTVVGLLIGIGGMLGTRGRPVDILGFGLVGSYGLAIYLNVLLGIGLCLGLIVFAFRRRPDWASRARRSIHWFPVVGSALEKISLARIAWALNLLMNVEIDLRRMAPIALGASNDPRFTEQCDKVVGLIAQGFPLAEAFGRTGVFPPQFLDTLEVAEEAGMISESMDRLSRQYDEESEHAIGILASVAAWLVTLLVMALVVVLIFRVFGFYLGAIQGALDGI